MIRAPAATFSGAWHSPPISGPGVPETGFHGGMGWMLQPIKVPAFGYTVVSWESLTSMAEASEGENEIVREPALSGHVR